MSSHLTKFMMGLILSLTSLTSYAASSVAPDNDPADGNSTFWTVYLAVPDVEKAIESVGGEWINAADLAKSGRPDDDYDGFILPGINALMVNKKETLDKFAAQAKVIYTPSFDVITLSDYAKIPYRDIICMMLADGQMRIATRDNINPAQNPASDFAAFLEVAGNFRAQERKSCCGESCAK